MRRFQLNWPEVAVFLLLVTLCAAFFALFAQVNRTRDVVLLRAVETADLLLDFAHESHAQHLRAVTHLLSQHERTSKIALNPARLASQCPVQFNPPITTKISDPHLGPERMRIYSDDPFKAARTRVLDDFAQEALAALQADDGTRHTRTEWRADGSARVRVAAPIKMGATCVACHNDQKWGLQNANWQPGDVRGVREVSVFVPRSALEVPATLWSFFAFVVVACLLGSGLLYPALQRALRQRAHFEGINHLLGKKAQKLARQANTDPLTGLANRRSFDNMLHVYVDEYSDSATHLGLIVFDLDHFKSVNDTHGHAQGDAVLARIADLTRNSVRREDCAARIGGEEFAVLCPGGARDRLLELADRLRRQIAALQFETEDGTARFGLTISVGVAELAPDDDPESLMKRADRCLYTAKARGRNQVCG